MNKFVQKLEEIAQSWGGSFKLIESFSDAFHLDSEFNSYVNSESFIVFNSLREELCFEPKTHWVDVIHGMGHIFTTKKELQFCPGDDCSNFHGWEYAMVKMIKAPIKTWYKMNADYMVSLNETPNNYVEFGDLSKIDKKRYLNQALERGRELKILNDEYKPLSIRR